MTQAHESTRLAGPPTTWAQNGEDVVLARGLTGATGFYVDIGAYDPEVESVTKLFYDRGWRGINVDPIASFVDRFDVERPRDINVCAAVGRDDGEAQIWVAAPEVPGHSTLHADVAAAHIADGLAFTPRVVPSMRVDTLLARYLPPGQVIDFLKVDVEGAEAEVVCSWDPVRFPARVVVVETVTPYVAGVSQEGWEGHLTGAGYRQVLFDGLNRFYVAGDEELAAVLSVPANVLDAHEPIGYRRVRDYAASLEAELAELRAWAGTLQQHVAWLEERLAADGRRAPA